MCAASVPPSPSIGMGQRQGSGHTGRRRKGRVRGGVCGQRLSCEKNVTNAGSQRRRGRESAPRSILRKRVGGWGAERLQGFGGLRRRSRVRGGPGKVPAPLGPLPTRRPAGPDGEPPQLRLLVCGKEPPGSEAGALTPSRLGQLPFRRTPHGAAPHLALGTLGRTHQPSSGLDGRRARVRVPEDRRAGAHTHQGTLARERRGLPEQVAAPGPRTTGQCSSGDRSGPQDHLVHSPPTSPIHPHLLRGR